MTFQRGIPVDIYGRMPAINLPERLFQKSFATIKFVRNSVTACRIFVPFVNLCISLNWIYSF